MGGWGMVLIHRPSCVALERAGGAPETTNNRMEMLGAIEALQALDREGVEIEIRTDSRYLIDCCTKWMAGWKQANWVRKHGALKNVDLLKRLDTLLERHRVGWAWVRGHSGDPGNERADALANLAMDRVSIGEMSAYQQRVEWGQAIPA